MAGQTWKTDESETNNDGMEEDEEGEEEEQNGNEEEDDDEEGNEENEEEQEEGEDEEVNEVDEEENMAPATPNPDSYCGFCNREFGTPRGLKIHKSGQAHRRRGEKEL